MKELIWFVVISGLASVSVHFQMYGLATAEVMLALFWLQEMRRE